MKVALISDLHGNLFALDAVLDALAAEAIDQVVCLGDVAIFGPQPRATLARLRELACPVVMGNTDAWALDPKPLPVRDEETVYFNALEAWGAEQLTADDRAFIRTFEPTVTVDLGGATLLCYHGSPHSYDDIIRATTPAADLDPWLGERAELLLAGGHTHEQYLRRYRHQYLLNPGSVGLPHETPAAGSTRNPPWAEYAVVTWQANHLQIDLRRVPYTVDPLIEYTRSCGMPHAEWWLEGWLA